MLWAAMGRFDSKLIHLALALTMWLGWVTDAGGQSETLREPAPIELEPLVITGTLIPTTLGRSTASVTVITQEQIAAQRARSVTELLRQVPGVHIDQAGARGSVSSVYLRGADPNYTVVLIDGVKVNDPTNSRGGSFDFSTLDVENVERIEIVRGPMSSIYGSDAMAGIIHIITTRGSSEPVRSLEISGGRFGYHRALLRAQGILGRVDYSLSGSYLDNGAPTEGSGFANKSFKANFGGLVADSIEIRSVLSYTDSHLEAFPDDSGGASFAVLRDVDERDVNELILGVDFSHGLSPSWLTSLHIEYYDREETIASPGVAPGVRDPLGIPSNISDSHYSRYGLTLRHRVMVTKKIRLGVGVEAQSEKGSSRGSLFFGGAPVPTNFELKRNLWAPFVEVRYAFSEGFLLEGGVRLDLPENLESEVSLRSSVSYKISSTHTTLRAGWGEGFKLPSFFALGHPIVGNTDLLPERSRSSDVTVTQSLWGEHITMSAAYFSNAFKNAIDLQEGPPPLLVNRSKIIGEGVEMEISIQAKPSLYLSSHLTYVNMDIKETDEELRNRPKWRGGFTVLWRPLSALGVNVETFYVGRALDSAIPTGDRDLNAYTRVNLAMTWTVSPKWQYFLAIDNLFDADYEEAIGFPAPGISPRIGFLASF